MTRYRRDELGDLDEANLWALAHAVQADQALAQRREELQQLWQSTALVDPAIGRAVHKANSKRMLDRLSRRLKQESSEHPSPSTRLAVRVLNPQKGDGEDLHAIASPVEGIDDPAAAVEGLDDALAKRLAGDPRIIGAAVRWLVKHARISIAKVSDPHTPSGGEESRGKKKETALPGKGTAKTPAATPRRRVKSSLILLSGPHLRPLCRTALFANCQASQ